jgi:hypothetical protein
MSRWLLLLGLADASDAAAPFGSAREGVAVNLQDAGGGGEASLCSSDVRRIPIGKPEGYWQGLYAGLSVNLSDPGRSVLDCFSRNDLTALNRTVENFAPPAQQYRTRRHLQFEFAAFTSEGGRRTGGGDDFSAYLYLESTLSSKAVNGNPGDFFRETGMTMAEGFVQDLENGRYKVHFATSVPGRYVVVLQHNFRCYQAILASRAGNMCCFGPTDLSVKGHPARAVLARVNVESPEVPDGQRAPCRQTQHGMWQAASGMWADGAWRPHCCDLEVASGQANHGQPVKFVGDSTMPGCAFKISWPVYHKGGEDGISHRTLEDWLANVVPQWPADTVLAINPSGLHLLDNLQWEGAKAATVDLVCSVLSQFKGAAVVLIGTVKLQREQHPEVHTHTQTLTNTNTQRVRSRSRERGREAAREGGRERERERGREREREGERTTDNRRAERGLLPTIH